MAVAATAAYSQKDRRDYFPLADGSRWSYTGRFTSAGGPSVPLQGTARVNGKTVIRGKEYYKYVITSNFSQVSRAHGSFEDVRYYRVSRAGIFIISGKDDDGPELLELPVPLRGGLKWNTGKAEAWAERAGTMKLGGRTYTHCLKVTYRTAGGVRRAEYYLAPGVGVIKAVYKDSAAPESVMEMTLEAYKR